MRRGAKALRNYVASLRNISTVEAAYLQSSSRFGEELANLLERKPEVALDIVNERVAAYAYLAHLGSIVRQFKIDFVIDAGAHSGQFASTLYGYGGYKGETHSFEPVKKYYDVMLRSLDYYPGWKAHNAALGDVPGASRIFVGQGHGGTSSLLPQTENLKNFAPDCQLGDPQDVMVHRVDEKFGDVLADPRRRVMLKLDVQGFEERVLKSAGDYIQNLKIVQMELSCVPLYQGQGDLAKVCLMMEDLGFALIYVCNSFGRNRSVFIDYDFIFCRRSELEAMKI